MPHMIRCRAKVDKACYDGQPTTKQFSDDLPMDEDGTYLPPDGMSRNDAAMALDDPGSIICDACYIRLMPLTPSGQGLHHELAAAIKLARGVNQ